MNIKLPVSKDDLYKISISVLTYKVGLTTSEVDVIVTLLRNNITTINSRARDILRQTLDKSKFSTNNYIKQLKDKQLLVKSDKGRELSLHPMLARLNKEKQITFEIDTVD